MLARSSMAGQAGRMGTACSLARWLAADLSGGDLQEGLPTGRLQLLVVVPP